MSLRSKMAKTATRLIGKYGDAQQFVTIVSTPGIDEFAPPTLTPTPVGVNAVVTGVSKWEVNETVLSTDLKVLVSGEVALFDVGGLMKIDGKNYTIIARNKVLAAGVASMVKYFVRAG